SITIDEYCAACTAAETAIAVPKASKAAANVTTPERKNPLFTFKLPDCAAKDIESSEDRLLNH
ncbi:MAG TPA: hypothetical protein VHY80_06415, partial [Stellaceae bacterium]|nr:hypothetical protein [Stellaceae bacterium]